MKKKSNYSLTSAQRKELKKKQAIKDGTHNSEKDIPLSEDQAIAIEIQNVEKKKRQSHIMKIAAVCFAVVLALSSITAGIIVGVGTTRHDNLGFDGAPVNPTAIIHLSTNQQIEIDLHFYNNPVIVANFIYLSLNNFFNNTIFHNTQGGFVAFSGFVTPASHRAEDSNFVANMSGFTTNRSSAYGNPNFKLGYRLNANTTILPHQQPRARALNLMPQNINGDYAPSGWIAMMAGDNDSAGSSTSFVMIHNDNPDFRVTRRHNEGQPDRAAVLMNARQTPTPVQTPINSLSYFGQITPASLEVIRDIANPSRNSRTRFAPSENRQNWINNFEHLTDYRSIYIRNISFRNLDRRLRNRIRDDFENFVLATRDADTNPDALGGLTGRWSRSEQGWWNDNRLQITG
ncbi:MAG: peptidylprolyl isomerase [Firmicutes bacterium]|nr:peptidylprolyl isomerase [Bacillota bacterium]